MPEHKDLPEAQLHEVKGAAAATSGQVLVADGLGSAAFAAPYTLSNLRSTQALYAFSTTTQNPAATDTPLQLTYGIAQATSYFTLSGAGLITCLQTGVYNISLFSAFSRTGGAGTANLLQRVTLNGAQYGVTSVYSLSDATATAPLFANFTLNLSATNTLTVEIMRDSSGINNGGVSSLNPVLAGWSDSPSCLISIRKIDGEVYV